MKGRAIGKKLKKKKKKKKQKIQKRKKNGIEEAKLAYLSFLCEEDDINFFCNFEEEWEQKNSRRASNEGPLACCNTLSVPPSKSDAVEQSYLRTLLQNEDFTCDKRSCSSVGFIFDKIFLRFANLDEQLRRDVRLGRSFRKGKKRRRRSGATKEKPLRGVTQVGASKLCANKNGVFRGSPYGNTPNESILREKRIMYEADQDAVFHHLAYSQLQDSLLQFYLPPGGYASGTPLRKNRATRADEGQRRGRYGIGGAGSKTKGALLSRGKLPARGVEKNTKKAKKAKQTEQTKKTKRAKHILPTAKRRGSRHTGERTERVKTDGVGATHRCSHPKSLLRLYNYSSSEDSDMTFLKFLPEPFRKKKKKKNKSPRETSTQGKKPHKRELQNDAAAIFDEIMQLCRRREIFAFKKKKKKSSRGGNVTHVKGERTVFPAELSNHGGKGDHSFAASNRGLNPPTGRNLSACPTMSGYHEGFRNHHVRAHLLGRGATPHVPRLTKKRSFSESSPIVERHPEKRSNSRAVKVCRVGVPPPASTASTAHGRQHRGYASSVVPPNCGDSRAEWSRFPNLMSAKRGKEKKMMKMQILEGLNQRRYDPGHLERMVSSKCFPLAGEKLRHALRRNVGVTLLGGDKNPKKKTKEPIGAFSWSGKWSSAKKLQFCSLYVDESYEMVVQMYRREYTPNDFYLTYVYAMALLKLGRYALCWEYLLGVGSTAATEAACTGLLPFLWGRLYEKLFLCRLSAEEYSKVVLNHVGKSTPSLHTQLRAREVKGASHSGRADLLPFILVCLDKLIGTGQLKRREESTILRFVQMNYNLGRVLIFYFCKVGSTGGLAHYPGEGDYTNAQKEGTFGWPPHRGRHKSCVDAVRLLRPPRLYRAEVGQGGDRFASERIGGERFSNTASRNFPNGWKATPPRPSFAPARCAHLARGYPQQATPRRDHRQLAGALLSTPPQRMHAEGHTKVKRPHHGGGANQKVITYNHGGVLPPRGLLQVSGGLHREVHPHVSNLLRGGEVSVLGRYNQRSDPFTSGDKVEDLDEKQLQDEKQLLAHFNLLLRGGPVPEQRVLLPHYDDLFECLFGVLFRSSSKWVINRAITWGGSRASNREKLAMRLKLMDVYAVGAFSPKGDRPICHEESHPARGKKSTHCAYPPLWCGKPIRSEKAILPDLLHIIQFCHKHFDFVNAYCLSECTLRREHSLGEEDAILLFVESITSMHSVVCTSQQKIQRLLQLYYARVNYVARKARRYCQSGRQTYGHTRDHLDYYLHGVIALLKGDHKQALLHLNKCVKSKGKFFQAYVNILHILCCSPRGNAFNSRQKKYIFHLCVQLKPFNLSPYLVYCSSVLRKLQFDLNREREKRGVNKRKRKKSLLIESTAFLRNIFSKAMHIDNENPFLHNELFVYHFLRKDFNQCKVVLRKMLLTQEFSAPRCSDFPLSVLLYNSSVFYFLCENHLNKSEKKIIQILHSNPFDVKALNLLTFLLFLKRDKYWTRFFDYSMYVERSLLARNVGSQRTYLCQSFFSRLRETRDMGLLARYYGALRAVRASFPFVLNYIRERYSAQLSSGVTEWQRS
ncbi:hypothetical protein PVNG_03175 [Plasmodium vivax North Korean]|uniref:Uncharacterized protein n=1 Tax=Plasmodium vivax North Korean TaxID=1035514 RepID=A0A0J9TUQ4_PLAVI|nr:hypothetical protein PVNG_03175 [Plasmodium vivax North Korean]